MIDTVQLILLVVIILLTLILVVLGVQVFFILQEVKKTLRKTNMILDNAESITNSLSQPISGLSSLLFSTKSLSILARLLHGSKKHE
jgi:uncharacterized protein YoxC